MRQKPNKPQIEIPDPVDFSTLSFDTNIPTSFDCQQNEEAKTAGGEIGLKTLRIHRKSSGRTSVDLSKVKKAHEQVGKLPGLEESIHFVVGGDFRGWDLVPTVHALIGQPLDLSISTLGFNLGNINHLCEMIDAGSIRSASILCSNYFKSADADVFNAAQDRLANRGVRMEAARNHTKLILFASGADRYVVESSANLRSCDNFEQFVLTNSPDLHCFYSDFLTSVFASIKPEPCLK